MAPKNNMASFVINFTPTPEHILIVDDEIGMIMPYNGKEGVSSFYSDIIDYYKSQIRDFNYNPKTDTLVVWVGDDAAERIYAAVMCRECRYSDTTHGHVCCNRLNYISFEVEDSGFCAWGEKKKEKEK